MRDLWTKKGKKGKNNKKSHKEKGIKEIIYIKEGQRG